MLFHNFTFISQHWSDQQCSLLISIAMLVLTFNGLPGASNLAVPGATSAVTTPFLCNICHFQSALTIEPFGEYLKCFTLGSIVPS